MQSSYRRLPHHYAIAEPLFVTFRLHGSLPSGRVFPGGRLSSGKAFACLDRLLDEQRAGPAYLRIPAIAEVAADAIGQGTAGDYLLHAWVVMPNHVHLLITPHVEVPALLRRLKGTSAREATNCWGKRVGRSGRTRAMIVSCGMPANSNESRAISSKPGASRARSIGRRIPLVEYLEAG